MDSSLKFSWPHKAELEKIFDALDYKVKFVGGCVRNAYLNRPITDIDLATIFTPDQVIQKLSAVGIRTIPTGIEHGTITAILPSITVEITTLRRDTSCDGRHATVEFTDNWREDASRRDFTMNALFLDWEGNLTDYFGGLNDLKSGILKFVGNANDRVKEDHLRILRYFRFLAWYGSEKIDEASLAACTSQAHKISSLSGERIHKEWTKLMLAPSPWNAISLLIKNHIHLNFCPTPSLENFNNLLPIENQFNLTPDNILRTAVIFSHAPEKIKNFCDQLKTSRNERESLEALFFVEPNFNWQNIEQNFYETIRKHGKTFALRRIFLIAAQEFSGELENLLSTIDIFQKKIHDWQIPVFPLTGDDLIKSGIQPGKKLGEKLSLLEKTWVFSNYKMSKEELIKKI